MITSTTSQFSTNWNQKGFGKQMSPLDNMTIAGWESQRREPKFDVVGFIMDYEGGEIGESEMIEGFQHLIDSGTVWNLQGHYGRTAAALIDAGYCH